MPSGNGPTGGAVDCDLRGRYRRQHRNNCRDKRSIEQVLLLLLKDNRINLFYRWSSESLSSSQLLPTPDSTCPAHYSCVQPLFGSAHICCTSSEHVCRDSVTAGTACFGTFMTIQRFHYNAERGQCEPFQYYGCNGSGNNFLTKRQCETACQPPVKSGLFVDGN